MLLLLLLSSVLGFPLYKDTINVRAATHQLFSFAIKFGLAPMDHEGEEFGAIERNPSLLVLDDEIMEMPGKALGVSW